MVSVTPVTSLILIVPAEFKVIFPPVNVDVPIVQPPIVESLLPFSVTLPPTVICPAFESPSPSILTPVPTFMCWSVPLITILPAAAAAEASVICK